MKANAVRDLSIDELRTKEKELVEEIFHLKLRRATGQLANPMGRRTARRDLARVKTVLAQRAAEKGNA